MRQFGLRPFPIDFYGIGESTANFILFRQYTLAEIGKSERFFDPGIESFRILIGAGIQLNNRKKGTVYGIELLKRMGMLRKNDPFFPEKWDHLEHSGANFSWRNPSHFEFRAYHQFSYQIRRTRKVSKLEALWANKDILAAQSGTVKDLYIRYGLSWNREYNDIFLFFPPKWKTGPLPPSNPFEDGYKIQFRINKPVFSDWLRIGTGLDIFDDRYRYSTVFDNCRYIAEELERPDCPLVFATTRKHNYYSFQVPISIQLSLTPPDFPVSIYGAGEGTVNFALFRKYRGPVIDTRRFFAPDIESFRAFLGGGLNGITARKI